MSLTDDDFFDEITNIKDGVTDLVNVAADQPNQHVEVIDRLDKITEVLERIATVLEAPVSDAELRRVSPALANLLKEGRVP